MTESQRNRIHELAELAEETAEEIRYIEEIPGEAWVMANELAEDLKALDLELAIEALA